MANLMTMITHMDTSALDLLYIYQFYTLLLYFMPDFYDAYTAPMIIINTPDGSIVDNMLWLQLPGAYEPLSKKERPTSVPFYNESHLKCSHLKCALYRFSGILTYFKF